MIYSCKIFLVFVEEFILKIKFFFTHLKLFLKLGALVSEKCALVGGSVQVTL